jgi:acetylornithine deacetylase/succinyl-diaminopimelate desuccinylase-like protein
MGTWSGRPVTKGEHRDRLTARGPAAYRPAVQQEPARPARDPIDDAIERHVRARLARSVDALRELCRWPSVSAENRSLPETGAAVRDVMRGFGIPAELRPTTAGNPPAVVARLEGRSSRRLLVYNHYDVQPVDPLDRWDSPPFEPMERDGRLYARGVADDKGDLLVRLAAVEAILAVEGDLPLPVTFLVEGQEEIDGPAIGDFMHANRELLACDVAFGEAGNLGPDGRPEIILGVKGILYVELEASGPTYGPTVDAHSSAAPVVENPAWVLLRALATLRDPSTGRVTIDGFYDPVVPWTDADRAALAPLAETAERGLRQGYGVREFIDGVTGAELARRYYEEPTCTIAGFHSGYGGPGLKTIVPASAVAKLDFRLVPDQRPETVLELLRSHLVRHGFGGIQIRPITTVVAPVRTPLDDPWVRRVATVTREWYGQEPVLVPINPGTQIFEPFRSALGAPAMFGGVRPSGGNAHAPNEYIELDSLVPAICFTAHLFRRLADID